jgi:hypothetical protein
VARSLSKSKKSWSSDSESGWFSGVTVRSWLLYVCRVWVAGEEKDEDEVEEEEQEQDR